MTELMYYFANHDVSSQIHPGRDSGLINHSGYKSVRLPDNLEFWWPASCKIGLDEHCHYLITGPTEFMLNFDIFLLLAILKLSSIYGNSL